MSQINTSQLVAISVFNALSPSEGPKVIPIVLDFTGSTTDYPLDLEALQTGGKFSMVQSLFIDNADGAAEIVVTINMTSQRIIAGKGTQGYYPVLCPNPFRCTFHSSGNGAKVTVFIQNMPTGVMIWSPS